MSEAKRTVFLVGVIAVGAIVAVFLFLHSQNIRKAAQPNVVLIVLDTLREDRVRAERDGAPVMPNLAALAEDSLEFTNVVTQCTWTRPSVASIFTSLYFDVHGVFFSADREQTETPVQSILPETLETLPEYLKNAGYTTWAIQTNGNLVEQTGFAAGFDEFEFIFNGRASKVTDVAIKKARELSNPFFMYAHYMDPHKPYDTSEKEVEVFGEGPELNDADRTKLNDVVSYSRDQVRSFFGLKDERDYGVLSKIGREAMKRLYDIECRFLDDHLGRLLDEVRTLHPNTLFVIVTDHGEELWEHGSLGHGTSMYAEQLDTVLLIHGPGVERGAIETVVESIDILPTISEYLGLESNPIWQGRSLLTPTFLEDRPAFSKTLGSTPRSHMDTEMVRRGRYKLIHKIRKEEVELYDVIEDPGDSIDLASKQPELVRELSVLLEEHRDRNAALVELHGIEGFESTLDEETLEHLRQLGYIR